MKTTDEVFASLMERKEAYETDFPSKRAISKGKHRIAVYAITAFAALLLIGSVVMIGAISGSHSLTIPPDPIASTSDFRTENTSGTDQELSAPAVSSEPQERFLSFAELLELPGKIEWADPRALSEFMVEEEFFRFEMWEGAFLDQNLLRLIKKADPDASIPFLVLNSQDECFSVNALNPDSYASLFALGCRIAEENGTFVVLAKKENLVRVLREMEQCCFANSSKRLFLQSVSPDDLKTERPLNFSEAVDSSDSFGS